MAKKTSSEFLRGKPTSGNREQLFAAINKLFAFLIIFTGLWVSTQYFAYLMGYDPVYVGYPFFIFRKEWFASGMYPLYIPWMFLFWITEFFKESDIAFLLRKAMYPWLGISLFAVVLYTVITYFRGFKQAAENIFVQPAGQGRKISRRKVS